MSDNLNSNLLTSEAPSAATTAEQEPSEEQKPTKTFDAEAGALETGVPKEDDLIASEKNKSLCQKHPKYTIAAGVVAIVALIVIIAVPLALLTGHKAHGSSDNAASNSSDSAQPTSSPTHSPTVVTNKYFEEQFATIPSNDSCFAYSKEFASKPHVAGMAQTRVLGSMFGEIMEDLGFEVTYDDIQNAVLDHYNSSSLMVNGRFVNLDQDPVDGQNETFTAFRSKAGVAYTPSGNVTAPLLYVNYGLASDYITLRDDYGIDFENAGTGYIALAKRYWPTYQAQYAAMYGLKGVILFDDFYVENASLQYPDTSALPNSAHRMDGRAVNRVSCPGSPDLNRLSEECGVNVTNDWLFPAIAHDIPMMAISPVAAIEIFLRMHNESDEACSSSNWPEPTGFETTGFESTLPFDDWSLPSGFESSLPIQECIGGTGQVMANMVTVNELHYNDTIQNVYGYWEGEVYPDEIVMIGAHRDAWGMGACDDISGTVSVLEIARSLSVLRDDYGWRPKRSLMFGSWDGEEWGLYGSVAFNEGDNEWKDRVVAYLNFDMTVVGGALKLGGNPMFRELLLETAQEIEYPYQHMTEHNNADDNNNWTLYDSWYDFDATDELENSIDVTVCNTDYCPFEFHSGVPTAGINFMGDFSLATTYHTFYDLTGWMDVVDPKWDFAESIATMGGLLMVKISQEHLLPLDVVRLAMKMEEWAVVDLATHLNETEMEGNCTFNSSNFGDIGGGAVAMATLEEIIGNLVRAAIDFEDLYNRTESEIESAGGVIDEDLSETVSTINGVLKNVMKRLSYSEGTPASKWYKQLLWGNWGTTKFPWIWSFISNGCEDEDYDEFQKAFDITINAINNVSALLMNAEL